MQKYNATTQTVDVLPAIDRPLRKNDGTTGYDKHPVIPNVKVAALKIAGSKFGLHGTLAAGDKVTIIFFDLSTAEFQTSGEQAQPFDTTHHAMSSAIALPIDITDGADWTTLNAGNRLGVDGGAYVDFTSANVTASKGGTPDNVAIASETTTFVNRLVTAVNTACAGVTGYLPINDTTFATAASGTLSTSLPNIASSVLKADK